jgi:PAS domain S-box-containing protein
LDNTKIFAHASAVEPCVVPEEASAQPQSGGVRLPLGEGSFTINDPVLRQIIDCSNDAVFFLSAEGRIDFINGRGVGLMELKGAEDVVGMDYVELFAPAEQDEVRQALRVAKTGRTARVTSFCSTAPGSPRWWNITVAPLVNGAGELIVISRDITEHIQVEKALRESEEAFRKLFEEGPVAMILGDCAFNIQKVNNAFCRMFGYPEREVLGRILSSIVDPVEGWLDTEQVQKLLSGETPSIQMEKRFLTRRKESVWGHMTVSVIRDPENQPRYTVGMIENITDRKLSQEQLLAYQEQLQTLASKLSLSEERERRRIATNLHDRIGQALAFAKLKLSAIAKTTSESVEPVNEVQDLIEQAIADTRSLTFELSPPVLYELGLPAALEWLARKIQQEHGITTRFHDDGQPKPVDEDIRVVLFQAVRELLVNVVKHAQATHAQVLVRRDSDALRIIIEDDGVGFDPSLAERGSEKSGFGLFSVRERLDYLGGRVKIRSEPGMGTRVTLLAPIKITEDHQKA